MLDEEGLLDGDPNKDFFQLEEKWQPMAGTAVIVGHDLKTDAYRNPVMTVSDVADTCDPLLGLALHHCGQHAEARLHVERVVRIARLTPQAPSSGYEYDDRTAAATQLCHIRCLPICVTMPLVSRPSASVPVMMVCLFI
jgi:hypothetical protein